MHDTALEFLRVYEILRTDIDRVLHPRASDAELLTIGEYGPGTVVALTPTERRAIVRAIFALAEASCYFLRIRLLESDVARPRLSPVQRLALAEEQVTISPSGIVDTNAMRTGTMTLIRMTFQVYADVFKGDFFSPCSGAEFDAFVKSIKVRDRLMHPKSVVHLEVTDNEIDDAIRGFAWLNKAVLVSVKAYTKFLVAENTKAEMKVALQEATAKPLLPGQAYKKSSD